MRKIAMMAVMATTALSAPAMAKDKAWYVGVEGGGIIVEDTHINIGAVDNAATANHKNGLFDVDGIVGYDLGMIRLEGEVGYKQVQIDSFRTTTRLTGVNAGDYHSKYSGDTEVLSFMGNALLNFGDDDGLQGYVGGGAGVARIKYNNYRLNGGNPFLDGSDTRFAFQAIAGVLYPVTKNVDVGVKYRFFNAFGVRVASSTFNAQALGDSTARFRSHSLLASLIYNFGEPTPPPPPEVPPAPPPPPATPPAPPPPPAVPGPFIVFFDWNKSNITPEAASILDNAAQSYATTGQASVMLAGHTDKSGSDSYNVGLSQRRADSVKSYLGGKGVPATAMQTEAFGESRPLVETADGVREPQNRRVEITFGPGAGQ